MIDKFVRSVAEAMAGIKDGSTVLIAGFAQVGEPRALIDGLIETGARNLTVVHNTLTISGEKRGAPDNIPPEAFHREERASGKFVRTVTLPVEIDEGKVAAEYKDGLLLITLPKSEKAKPKQINVQVS